VNATPVNTRFPPDEIAHLDAWIAAQEDAPSRPEAVRRLVEIALSRSRSTKQRHPKAASKAADMAGEQIDKLIEPATPAEEQQKRKRRLLKGPGEFRELRKDSKKAI
jgi:hypothetical protein